MDGREELIEEMAAAPVELRQSVASAFVPLLTSQDFVNVLPGLMTEPERAGLLMDRLRALCR